MNIGDKIVMKETVLVLDDIGTDFVLSGTEGTIIGFEGSMLKVKTSKGTYSSIPPASVILQTEDKAA